MSCGNPILTPRGWPSLAGAHQWLRMLLGALALWDVLWGGLALIHAGALRPPWLTPQPGDLGYIRVLGVFWLFMAYVQALAGSDLVRYRLAAQLAVALRLPTGLLNLYLVFVEYPHPMSGHAQAVLSFGLGDLAIWLTGAWLLRRLGSPWLAWGRVMR